jgi:hypothetical protein
MPSQIVAYSGFSSTNYIREPYNTDLDFGTGEWNISSWVNIPSSNSVAATIASRYNSLTTPYITLGIDATNKLTATAFDGTTTRTVTTTSVYNTATWLKAEVNYRAGRLSILVNGQEVAVTNGAPLLTLNNSNAVLTIGNNYDLNAPFPGSLALLKLSATVPTIEQSIWMYEQEKQMFRDNAQICLPDSNTINDLAYDDLTDRWIAVSNTNKSIWNGLVRVASDAVPAGTYSKVTATSGVQLASRITTNPGVDITIPAYNVRTKVKKKAEKSKRNSNAVSIYDFTPIVFTNATLTNGSNIMTCSTISGVPYIGMGITGTGITAGMTIIGINGTNYYLSANYTGTTGSTYTVGQSTFTLPVGYTAQSVYSGGVLQREGAAKNYTRTFDGFRETVVFATSPGTSLVQIHGIKQ